MTVNSYGHGQHVPGIPSGERPLMCAGCGTDRGITVYSIEALNPRSSGMVEVGYSCIRCRRHFLHSADVGAVATIVNRTSSLTGVLVFGPHYIHCGQPMQKSGSELRRLSAPRFTDRSSEDVLDVYLATRVLRCSCGFQMEMPE